MYKIILAKKILFTSFVFSLFAGFIFPITANADLGVANEVATKEEYSNPSKINQETEIFDSVNIEHIVIDGVNKVKATSNSVATYEKSLRIYSSENILLAETYSEDFLTYDIPRLENSYYATFGDFKSENITPFNQENIWSLTLTSDKTVYNQDESVELTTTASYPDYSSGYAIYFVNAQDEIVGYRGLYSGAWYSVSTNADTEKYHAVIAKNVSDWYNKKSSELVDVKIKSNIISTVKNNVQVTINIDKSEIAVGEKALLTYELSYGLSSYYYSVYIVDEETGDIVYTVSASSSGTQEISFSSGDPKNYKAYVAQRASYPYSVTDLKNILSSSNAVNLKRTPWSVSVTSEKPTFDVGEKAKLHWKTNQALSGWDYYPYYALYLYDKTEGKIIAQQSPSDTGYFETAFSSGGPHEYEIYVARKVSTYQNMPELDDLEEVQAISNSVKLQRTPWEVSLDSNLTTFSIEDTIDFTINTEQFNSYNYNYYKPYIVEVESGNIISSERNNSVTTSFTGRYLFWTGGPRSYKVVIAVPKQDAGYYLNNINQLEDIQAESNHVTLTRAPWTIIPKVDSWVEDEYWYSQPIYRNYISYETNQSRRYSPFIGGLYNVTTGEWIDYSTRNGANVADFYSDPNKAEEFQWIYGEPTGDPLNPVSVVEARSEVFTLAQPGGPTGKYETTGGSNPSENCVQSCTGDPINTATGEFWESNNDIIIPQNGPLLAFVRSFATSKKDEQQGMGYGWTHNYNMFLKYADEKGVETSSEKAHDITVVQENGSEVVFAKMSTGKFEAPARVKANLVQNNDGSIVFTRENASSFIFSSNGQLVKITDRNNNSIQLSYNLDKHLSRISNDKNQFISLAWKEEKVSSVTDHTGRTVTYSYDKNDDLVSVTSINDVIRKYTYDAQHRVSSLQNELGGLTKNTYKGENDHRVSSQTDPRGNVISFDFSGNATIITYPNGNIVTEVYNGQKQLSSRYEFDGNQYIQYSYKYTSDNYISQTINPLGHTTYAGYDQNGNPTSLQGPDGVMTYMTYDKFGNILTITDALGNITTNTYDDKGNPLTSISPEGRVKKYTINSNGSIATSVSEKGNIEGSNASDYTSSYQYNELGYLKALIDSKGNKSTMVTDTLGRITKTVEPLGNLLGANENDYAYVLSYDVMGNVISSTNPDGSVEKTTYDNMGNILTTEDALGNINRFEYDNVGNLIRSVNPLGKQTSFVYDEMDQLTKIVDANGGISEISYDKFGRVIKTQDALGNSITNTWDELGRLISSTDADGKVTEYTYDANGNIVSSKTPKGDVSSFSYDAISQLTSMTDAENRTTQLTYTKDGLVSKTTRPDGSIVSMDYDASGNSVLSTDAAGNSKSWEYDALGNQISFVDEMQIAEDAEYDVSGRIVSKTRTDGSIVSYEYDRVGNITKINYPGVDMDINYVYNANGMKISEQKGSSPVVGYAYDNLGQLKARGPPEKKVEYSYDDIGNQTSIKYPSGRTVDYNYDSSSNLTGLKTDGITEVNFEYNKRGLNTKTTLPTGLQTLSSYDDNGSLLSLNVVNNDVNLYNKSYQYTPTGNILQQSVGTDVPSLDDYTYDPLSRLTSKINNLEGEAVNSYEYNVIGNLTKNNGIDQGYDSSGKILSSENSVFEYDLRGNRIQSSDSFDLANNKNYVWDEGNLLVGLNYQDKNIRYTYDASGLISSRSSNETQTNDFIWDSNNSIPLMLDDGNYEYIYGVDRTPIAQIDKNTDEVTYLHSDMIGSVVATSDDSGIMIAETSYTPYGSNRGESLSAFGFAGEWTDVDTNLSYIRARWLDTSTGTFLSVDPLVQSTGESYGYTGGNPLSRIDPLGLAFLGGNAFSFMDSSGFQEFTNFVSGLGDSVSMGGTSAIRDLLGINSVINTCSSFYSAGEWTGVAATIITPGQVGYHLSAKSGGEMIEYISKKAITGENPVATAFKKSGPGNLTAKEARTKFSQKDVDNYLTGPGVYANGNIPVTRTPPNTYLSSKEKERFNNIGDENGCHHCGIEVPGFKNWVRDHIPPTALREKSSQNFYPQCKGCMIEQSAAVRRAVRNK